MSGINSDFFTFEINYDLLNRLKNAQQPALEMTADAMLTDMKQKQLMPFDTGNMQNQNTFVETKGKNINISTTTPYALRLYYHPEYNFNRSKNSNAGALWWDRYLEGNEDWVVNTYAVFFRRLARI